MRCKFLQDIYLEYLFIFRASWLRFGTESTQAFPSHLASFVFANCEQRSLLCTLTSGMRPLCRFVTLTIRSQSITSQLEQH